MFGKGWLKIRQKKNLKKFADSAKTSLNFKGRTC